MSGRRCEVCAERAAGSCPFNYACRREVFERFGNWVSARDNYVNKKGRDAFRVSLSPVSAAGAGEVKA